MATGTLEGVKRRDRFGQVTSAVLDGRAFSNADEDPVVGMLIGGSNSRVAAKIVDLDPQEQMVSQIWGLCVRLEDRQGVPL